MASKYEWVCKYMVISLIIVTLYSHAAVDTIDTTQYNNDDEDISSAIIQTTHGPVRGMTEVIAIQGGHEVKVDVFWGIPFAKPPVGDLRFKRPVSADPWDDVLNATSPPASCMQILEEDPILFPNPSTPVSEDCLYLNIWRPKCHDNASSHDDFETTTTGYVKNNGSLITMIWIHGGGYMTGSTTVSTYNGAVLAASECVIVASMNYRLGALGFMFLDIPEVPGNMGLLDMTLAVTWIKDNIQNFGGDPNSITIFGNSAGGASTSLFLLSPLTQQLFQRAIIQSGSPISHLAIGTRTSALETAYEFSKAFECYSENSTEIAWCLNKVDVRVLTEEHYNLARDYRFFMTAVVDYYFLTKSPIDVFQNKEFKKCSILLGSTLDEGTYFMGLKWAGIYNFSQEQTESVTEQVLDKKLIEFFNGFLNPVNIPSILTDVKKTYQLDKLRLLVKDAHLTLLDYVIGDVINTCPVRQIAQLYHQASQDVFLYSFDHPLDLDSTPLASWVGAIHGIELDFMFGKASVSLADFSPREAELSKELMTFWANFAKFGSPTPPEHNRDLFWPTYTGSDPGDYVQFTSSADIRISRTEDARCAYWNNLPRGYLKS